MYYCCFDRLSIGAQLALRIDDGVFKRLMLIIIPVTAFYVLRSRGLDSRKDSPDRLKAVLIALGIGVYDGFYGPGTGTFLLLLLTLFAGYKISEANGIAKSINLTTNLTALAVYMYNGKVLILLGVCTGLCSVIGNYMGITFFEKAGAKLLNLSC